MLPAFFLDCCLTQVPAFYLVCCSEVLQASALSDQQGRSHFVSQVTIHYWHLFRAAFFKSPRRRDSRGHFARRANLLFACNLAVKFETESVLVSSLCGVWQRPTRQTLHACQVGKNNMFVAGARRKDWVLTIWTTYAAFSRSNVKNVSCSESTCCLCFHVSQFLFLSGPKWQRHHHQECRCVWRLRLVADQVQRQGSRSLVTWVNQVKSLRQSQRTRARTPWREPCCFDFRDQGLWATGEDLPWETILTWLPLGFSNAGFKQVILKSYPPVACCRLLGIALSWKEQLIKWAVADGFPSFKPPADKSKHSDSSGSSDLEIGIPKQTVPKKNRHWSMFLWLCSDPTSKISPTKVSPSPIVGLSTAQLRFLMILRFFDVFLLVLAAAWRAQRRCDEGFDWSTGLPTNNAGRHWWRHDSRSRWATIVLAHWMSANV